MRFMARLHFVWSYYGEHLGLRIFMAFRLLQVLLFLLPATAAATATAALKSDLHQYVFLRQSRHLR
jgi:hypothetical protein